MTYQVELFEHLRQYKQTVLGIRESGVFKFRGRLIPKEHILPAEKRWDNLLEPARGLTQRYQRTNPRLKLHRYFHHLNSSQAFAFNLFFPLFSGGKQASAALLRALHQTGELLDWEPEAIPDENEGTNLDVRWHFRDGSSTLCEVKLSESEFGKAKNDKAHHDKLRKIYAPTLRDHVPPKFLEPAQFFANYQILRNIWHMVRQPGAHLIFLLPRANQPLWREINKTIDRLGAALQSRVLVLSIEDVLHTLVNDSACDYTMREYARRLQERYVLPLGSADT